MNDLQFSIDVAAPVARVWDCMFEPDTYRDWSSAFSEGSFYEGSWEAGEQIAFLDPSGFGMAAVIDENRHHECIALRLVAELRDGLPIADGPLSREHAHERYEFSPLPDGGTRLIVQVQGWDEGFTQFLQNTWPQALARLKRLSEFRT